MKKLFNVLAVIAIALGFASCKPKTPADPYASYKIDIKLSNIVYNGADISVTPSHDSLYYVCSYAPKDAYVEKYGEMSDSAVIADMVDYFDQVIDFYAQLGRDITYEDLLVKGAYDDVLEGLDGSTTYIAYAFYLSPKGKIIVPRIYKQEFTTAEYVAPSKVSFTINVSDITSSTASVSVTAKPADAYYYFDIVDKRSFDGLGGARGAAQYLIDDLNDQLDIYGYTLAQVLSQGTDSYDYSGLNGSTEYVVIAVAVNPFTGELIGDAATKNFTTTEASLADVFPTTLRGNVSFTPASRIIYANAGRLENGASVYYVEVDNARETEGCQFYLVAAQGTQVFGQTYTIDANMTGRVGTALPGYLENNQYIAGSWYYTMSGNSITEPYAALCGGTVAFSQNGENTTITINATDALNHVVSGTATLPLEEVTFSAPAKKAPKATKIGRPIEAKKVEPKIVTFKH